MLQQKVTTNSSGRNCWSMEGIWIFGQLKDAIKRRRDNTILMEEYKQHWDTVLSSNKRQRDTIEEGTGGNSLKSRRLGGIDWSSISNFSGV